MIGTTISHYKILEKLGGGGMGVVYKAEDTRLKRTVALKFLPPDLTRSDEANRRFIHEAQAASALEHSNICTIHEIGETGDGQLFITMACYEGETLGKRIERGPLEISEALEVALQMARGIARAHEAGIMHRDIKPANIMLTHRGEVRILDFGLAKLVGQTRLTQSGSTLGTASYMSPEQARGEEVDRRTDIWSFGIVFYEMLTGRVPLKGEFQPAVVYSILNEDPPSPRKLKDDISQDLETIILHALEKKAADRYQTMNELLADLETVKKETSATPRARLRPIRHKRRWTKRPLLGASALVVAVGSILIIYFYPRERTIEWNPNAVLRNIEVPGLTYLVYPGLSPDGKWIAFGARDSVRQWDVYFMNTSGGEPQRITSEPNDGGLVSGISGDGAWVFYSRTYEGNSEIRMVPSLGGSSRFIAYGSKPIPWLDGVEQRVMFARDSTTGRSRLSIFHSTSGRISLWSSRLDGSDVRLELADSSFRCSEFLWDYAVSPDGKRIAWLKSSPEFHQELVVRHRDTGEDRQLTFDKANIEGVFWTQDDFIVYSSSKGGTFDLWMIPSEGGSATRLTVSSAHEWIGEVSADGTKMTYLQFQFKTDILLGDLVTGAVNKVTTEDAVCEDASLSPDGRFIAFRRSDASGKSHPLDLYLIGREGKGRRHLASGNPFVNRAAWSPDGRWIAYSSVHSTGEPSRVLLVSPDDPGIKRELGYGDNPRWIDSSTICWDHQMRSWIAGIDDPNPTPLYQDSTSATPILDGSWIVFRDYRTGREGWWIDTLATGSRQSEPRNLASTNYPVALAPNGEFMLCNHGDDGLWKISLPDGKKERIPHRYPALRTDFSISADGREIVYREFEGEGKLILVENPFK